MTQQFKFGDCVRVLKKSVYNQEIGVVTKISNTPKPRYRVAFENELDLTFSESELELVPHPDTVRLDYIQNRLPEIRLVECNEAGAVAFCLTRKSGFVCTNTLSPSIRETIDNAMQQEQMP